MSAPKPDNRQLRNLFEEHFVGPRADRMSRPAVGRYRRILKAIATYLNREPVVSDLTEQLVYGFNEWLASPGAARSSVPGKYPAATLWRALARRGLVPRIPAALLRCILPIPSNRGGRRKLSNATSAWSKEELAKLWSACQSARGFVGAVKASDWWSALNAVLWDTAERVGTVLQLRWEWVDLERQWIRLPAETRKGPQGDHWHRLSPSTIESLRSLGPTPEGAVFVWTNHKSNVWSRYGRLLQRAGLSSDRPFDRLRRTAAAAYRGHDERTKGGDS